MTRRALIVGGTRGAGRALARKWASEGAEVTVVGRTPPPEADLRAGVRFARADAAREAPFASALARAAAGGPLDALAFFQRYRGGDGDWDGELKVGLSAVRAGIERLAGSLRPGAGAVAVVGSIAGRLVASECSPGYHAAKAALEQLVRYYAVSLGPRGIRVNGVVPGSFVKEESREFYRKQKALSGAISRATPLGRLGTAEELAEVAAFLCGPSASFVTGQNLVMDGGLSLVSQESLARRLAS